MDSAGIGQFIPLILIFVIFYFFLIRPQQKKVKEHKAMVESLKKGDKIVTSGGITGTISRVVDNDKIEVEIAEQEALRYETLNRSLDDQVLFKLFLDKWDGSTQVVPGLPGSEGGTPPVIVGGRK